MKKRALFGAVIFILMFASFIFGVEFSKKNIGHALDFTQGELAFHSLERYRMIKSDLEMGCKKQALDKINFSIDEKMMLLAEYVQHHKTVEIIEYLTKKDGALLKQLESYHIDWNRSWVEEGCIPPAVAE